MASSNYSAASLDFLAPRAQLPWTICVLFYGNHPHLCSRFLESLYRWTDPSAFELRAGLNAVCEETAALVAGTAETHGNVSVIRSKQNIYKCPMMRRLFHDEPITTPWTLWFDDDSHVTGPGWILDLAMAMERRREVELFGSLRAVNVSETLERFITSAHWYRGIPRATNSEGNGRIVFPVGGFWAVSSERIVQTGWPDERLEHFQTDFTMAEAMRQQGVEMEHFESGVAIDDAERRAPEGVSYEIRVDYNSPT